MSVKFDDFLKEQLQDPEFKKEYEALQPERAIIQGNYLNGQALHRVTSVSLKEAMPIRRSVHYRDLLLGWA